MPSAGLRRMASARRASRRTRLSAASGKPVTVECSTVPDPEPEAGVDYAAGAGTLTFAPGETFKVVSIDVYGDTIHERGQLWNTEWLSIEMAAPTNATFGTGVLATKALGLIYNDD